MDVLLITMFATQLPNNDHADANNKDLPHQDEHEFHADNGCTVAQKDRLYNGLIDDPFIPDHFVLSNVLAQLS